MARRKKLRRNANAGRAIEQLAIADLKAALAAKQRQLAVLVRQRKELVDALATVDANIAILAGAMPARRGRSPAAPKAPAKKVVRRRKVAKHTPRQGATLSNKLAEILGAAPKPLRVVELVEAVRQSGYPSKSAHLRSMINQAIRRDPRFRKVRRGLYKLA